MYRIALSFLIAAFLVGTSVSTLTAGDEPPTTDPVAAFERRFAELQQRIEAVQKEVSAARARLTSQVARPLTWTKLVDEEHLRARLTVAAKEKQPTVVFVHATWCTYCKMYKDLIERDAVLRRGFEGLVRLEIDVEREDRADLRRAAGIGPRQQPWIVFFDTNGHPVPDAAIRKWRMEESAAALVRSLRSVAPE